MQVQSGNLFLSSLSSRDRDFLLARSTAADLPVRTVLYEPDQKPKHAYFITSGIASVVAPVGEAGTAEVGVIGNEGVVGSMHLLGDAPVPTQCFMQMSGAALRIPFAVLLEVFRSSEEIRDRILEFVQQQALCVSQIAGCNRLHGAEERLSRWLLMVQDRIDSDTLDLYPGIPGGDAWRAANHGHYGGRRAAGLRPDRVSPRAREDCKPPKSRRCGLRLLSSGQTASSQSLQTKRSGRE